MSVTPTTMQEVISMLISPHGPWYVIGVMKIPTEDWHFKCVSLVCLLQVNSFFFVETCMVKRKRGL